MANNFSTMSHFVIRVLCLSNTMEQKRKQGATKLDEAVNKLA